MTQIVDYAKENGLLRKASDISERGTKAEVDIDFLDTVDENKVDDLKRYTTSVGGAWHDQ